MLCIPVLLAMIATPTPPPDKITVAKLNIDENPGTARDYQVMSIPTMAVFSGGKIVKTIVGARPKSAILNELSDFVG